MAKKKASAKGRKAFQRKVTTITKDLKIVKPIESETVENENKQIDLTDMIEEVEKETIIIERGTLNHNWVVREYGVSVEEAKELVKQANK